MFTYLPDHLLIPCHPFLGGFRPAVTEKKGWNTVVLLWSNVI